MLRATRGALQASFSIDPAPAPAHLQQGLPTTEVGQEHGTAVRVDEVVPLELLAQLAFFASGHQATLVSLQWKGGVRAYAQGVLPALSPVGNPQQIRPHRARRAAHWNLTLPPRQDQDKDDGQRPHKSRSRR